MTKGEAIETFQLMLDGRSVGGFDRLTEAMEFAVAALRAESADDAVATAVENFCARLSAVLSSKGMHTAVAVVAAVPRARAESVAGKELQLSLPKSLTDAIDAYVATDWRGGCDPSGYGSVNAVAYIGERISALYVAALKRKGST